MRNLVIKRIKDEWSSGREEGLAPACHLMKWKCEQDYDYKEDKPPMFAVHTNNSTDVYVIEYGKVNEDLDIVLAGMSDQALLMFWEGQLCLKYR